MNERMETKRAGMEEERSDQASTAVTV